MGLRESGLHAQWPRLAGSFAHFRHHAPRCEGKTELIWPVFNYGDNQANAEVLDHTLVFTAILPDGSAVFDVAPRG